MPEILGVVVNTLTADGKYPGRDCENSLLPIWMELSEKRKKIFEFFDQLLKSTSNFKHFKKKDELHSYCISKITDYERLD